MNRSAKTIQIFLPSGDPRGIRVADITTRIVRMIDVPRALLSDFLEMPEARQVGVYFLVGEPATSADPRLYIGQSGAGVGGRLVQQDAAKEYWNRALVLISLTNSITQTHALFLEWHCLKEAADICRYSLENGTVGSKPHTPQPLEADCLEIYDTARTLLTALGYPVFEPLSKTLSSNSERDLLYCKMAGIEGRGEYTSEGFVVLRGSTARLENVPSIQGSAAQRYRERLVESDVMVEKNGVYEFSKDYLFSSPSMASMAILGRTSNGWLDWKAKNGVTLNDLKRQPQDNLPITENL